MRKNPPETIPNPNRRANPDIIIMERDYKLITPLYGGGVKAGEVDIATPIHGTGIRGQLRFWWRATRGGSFAGNSEKMKAAEDLIWGSTEGGSAVSIAVIRCTSGKPFQIRHNGQLIDVGHVRSPYSYVAFPLRRQDRVPAGVVYEGVIFTLQLSFPDSAKDDVQAALWAWETFGGVGARTRRGFGALQCTDVQPNDGSASVDIGQWRWEYDAQNAAAQLLDAVERFVSNGEFPRGVPHLSRLKERYKIKFADSDPLKVWRDLFGRLKDFRQNRAGRYGRSNWPEPDAIRQETGQSLRSRGHSDPVYDPIIDKFPRAIFGLPIIFAFKEEDSHPTDPDKDPRETMLTGRREGIDRLASPLILRPLACRDRTNVGLALILNAPLLPPGGIALKGAGVNKPADPRLEKGEINTINQKHTWGNISVDILQSFLNKL
jgi:CRISPR-associated protein Cmr1